MFENVKFESEEAKAAAIAEVEALKAGTVSKDQLDKVLLSVKKLEDKNKEIKAEKEGVLGELQKTKVTLEKLGGDEGIDRILNLINDQEENEIGKLLKEGNITGFIERTTKNIEGRFSSQISSLEDQLKAAAESLAKAETIGKERLHTIHDTRIADTLRTAATKELMLPDAVDQFIQLHTEKFSYQDEDKQVVMLDKDGSILFGKEAGKPKSALEFVQERKEDQAYFWPNSQSGGAAGSGSDAGRNGQFTISRADAGNFTKYNALHEAAKKAGQTVQIVD